MKRKVETSFRNETLKDNKRIQANAFDWISLPVDCWDEILLNMDFFCLIKSMKITSWIRKKIISISLLKRWMIVNMKNPDIFLKENNFVETIKRLANYYLMLRSGTHNVIPLDVSFDVNSVEKESGSNCLIHKTIKYTLDSGNTVSISYHKTQPFCMIQIIKERDVNQIEFGNTVIFLLFHREQRIAVFEEKNIKESLFRGSISTINGYVFAMFQLEKCWRIIAVPTENPTSYLHVDICSDRPEINFYFSGEFLCVCHYEKQKDGDIGSLWVFTLDDFVSKDQEKVASPLLSDIIFPSLFGSQKKYLLVDYLQSKDMLLAIRDSKRNCFLIHKIVKRSESPCRYVYLEGNVLSFIFDYGTYELAENLLDPTKILTLDNDCKFTFLDIKDCSSFKIFRNNQKELVFADPQKYLISFVTKTKIENVNVNPFVYRSCGSCIGLFLYQENEIMSFVDLENIQYNTFSNDSLFGKEKNRIQDKVGNINFWSHTACYTIGEDYQICFMDFLCKENSTSS